MDQMKDINNQELEAFIDASPQWYAGDIEIKVGTIVYFLTRKLGWQWVSTADVENAFRLVGEPLNVTVSRLFRDADNQYGPLNGRYGPLNGGYVLSRDFRKYIEELGGYTHETTAGNDQVERENRIAKPLLEASEKPSRRVFVVHGHDGEAKEQVARFLEKLDLEAIILHEQPNQGRTVIEKIEKHGDVGFAVIVITPDDEGGVRSNYQNEETKLQPRARQNVILELGYFVGFVGRDRVCALVRGKGIELPSDVAGVVYEPMDDGGGWRTKLAMEIKAAGIDVDLNKMA